MDWITSSQFYSSQQNDGLDHFYIQYKTLSKNMLSPDQTIFPCASNQMHALILQRSSLTKYNVNSLIIYLQNV